MLPRLWCLKYANWIIFYVTLSMKFEIYQQNFFCVNLSMMFTICQMNSFQRDKTFQNRYPRYATNMHLKMRFQFWLVCFRYLLWHIWDTMKGVRQADDFFGLFWRENKQRSEIEIFEETGSGQGDAREGVGKKNSEKAVGEGRRRGAVDNGQQWGRRSKTSRHS